MTMEIHRNAQEWHAMAESTLTSPPNSPDPKKILTLLVLTKRNAELSAS
jgi:hypothetical protein